MASSFFGNILILVLVIINCSRMFFLRYGKVDTLTVLAPVSIVQCILQILAWGADPFSILVLIICILDFCTNFRALLRFVSGLYVDHYSIAFKIGAFVVLVLAVFEAGLILYFFPKNILPSQYNVKETKIPITGTFTRGFEKAGFFERTDGMIYVFSPEKKEIDKKQSIIIIPDKRGDTLSYLPYICSLSKIGYTVYSADFYAKDLNWFNSIGDSKYFRKMFMCISAERNKVQFEGEKGFFTFNTMRECEAIFNFVKERETTDGKFEPVLMVSDWMSENSVSDFAKLHPDEVCATFNLTDFDAYKTAGYGFVELMNPFMAWQLGCKRNRDLYVPSYLAMETFEVIPERKYKDPEPAAEPEESSENQVQVTIHEGELE